MVLDSDIHESWIKVLYRLNYLLIEQQNELLKDIFLKKISYILPSQNMI